MGKHQVGTKAEGKPGGMAFMRAARDAMPSTIGDRARSAAMGEIMSMAIRCRFRFALDDALELDKTGRFGIETSVGVFRALDPAYYAAACSYGGTYARMWEQYKGVRQWVARMALAKQTLSGSNMDVLQDNRVAEGLGVMVPSPAADDEADLARTRDHEVWWCTSVDDAEIVLCRYRYRGERRYPGMREGSPARRMKLSRKEWEALMERCKAAEPTVAAPEAANTAG